MVVYNKEALLVWPGNGADLKDELAERKRVQDYFKKEKDAAEKRGAQYHHDVLHCALLPVLRGIKVERIVRTLRKIADDLEKNLIETAIDPTEQERGRNAD